MLQACFDGCRCTQQLLCVLLHIEPAKHVILLTFSVNGKGSKAYSLHKLAVPSGVRFSPEE